MFKELNISKVSRQELLDRTSHLIAQERKITAQLLLHLEEIERRKLHLEMGFSSMFDYLTKGHGYSSGAADRRITAMRLARDVPQVAHAIETGKMSLNVASQVGHFLRNEHKAGKVYTPEQKAELTMRMAGKSTRDCECALLEISPTSAAHPERTRAITATETEIRFTANAELMAKFERLRCLLAHHGNLGYAQLFERLADRELKRIDPMRTPAASAPAQSDVRGGQVTSQQSEAQVDPVTPQRSDSHQVAPVSVAQATGDTSVVCDETPARSEIRGAKTPARSEIRGAKTPARSGIRGAVSVVTGAGTPASVRKYRPHIPLVDRREVWRRAGGKCQYCDPKTGRRCNSTWALEIDHEKPLGQNGAHGLANFRLVCCRHNKFLAEKAYGSAFMARYLRSGVKQKN